MRSDLPEGMRPILTLPNGTPDGDGPRWTLCADEKRRPVVVSPNGHHVELVERGDEIMREIAERDGWISAGETWLREHWQERGDEFAAALLAVRRWKNCWAYSPPA
jgi:hypothetical protein